MTCNACNMLIEAEERKVPTNTKDYAYWDDDYCYVDYDNESNKYYLHVDYDCGYAATMVNDIHYCPFCGRELN